MRSSRIWFDADPDSVIDTLELIFAHAPRMRVLPSNRRHGDRLAMRARHSGGSR